MLVAELKAPYLSEALACQHWNFSGFPISSRLTWKVLPKPGEKQPDRLWNRVWKNFEFVPETCGDKASVGRYLLEGMKESKGVFVQFLGNEYQMISRFESLKLNRVASLDVSV